MKMAIGRGMSMKMAIGRGMSLILTMIVFAVTAIPAFAHQPFFEDRDFTAAAPYRVADPTVSTAVYATLASAKDVDYYAFQGKKGQRILLSMTIPQVAGQESFAPDMALMGPGLPTGKHPAGIERRRGDGVKLLPALKGKANTFYEPFSRTSYWERQEARVTLPADGPYVVAVWHAQGQPGRYTFVIGDRERLGGDPLFGRKLRAFWTPVGTGAGQAN
jgi:hypothetical protein